MIDNKQNESSRTQHIREQYTQAENELIILYGRKTLLDATIDRVEQNMQEMRGALQECIRIDHEV